MATDYIRTLPELKAAAANFWPKDIAEQEAELSIVPVLLTTQQDFISILGVKVADHLGLLGVLSASKFPANLFLKHLSVLADVGSETLQRWNTSFGSFFPSGELDYLRDGAIAKYKFKALPTRSRLTSKILGIGARQLVDEKTLDDLLSDVIVLLVFGGSSTDEAVASALAKCEISNYIGNRERLSDFVKQRYIWVSRITGGTKSNNMGQLAQAFVRDYLKEKLPSLVFSTKIPGIYHSKKRLTTFDIVASNRAKNKFAGIEVSFQVTTNSVIERKAGQARARFNQLNKKGYKICYVIDGAGNFERESALTTIITNSHCNVAFTKPEIDTLVEFLRDYFQGR